MRSVRRNPNNFNCRASSLLLVLAAIVFVTANEPSNEEVEVAKKTALKAEEALAQRTEAEQKARAETREAAEKANATKEEAEEALQKATEKAAAAADKVEKAAMVKEIAEKKEVEAAQAEAQAVERAHEESGKASEKEVAEKGLKAPSSEGEPESKAEAGQASEGAPQPTTLDTDRILAEVKEAAEKAAIASGVERQRAAEAQREMKTKAEVAQKQDAQIEEAKQRNAAVLADAKRKWEADTAAMIQAEQSALDAVAGAREGVEKATEAAEEKGEKAKSASSSRKEVASKSDAAGLFMLHEKQGLEEEQGEARRIAAQEAAEEAARLEEAARQARVDAEAARALVEEKRGIAEAAGLNLSSISVSPEAVEGEAVSSEAPGLLKRIASQLASLLPSEGGDSNTNLPSIVLIVLAGIGQGDVSTDLAHPKATPAIARLAHSGVTLARHYAPAQLAGTSAALLTGQYPWRWGIPGAMQPGARHGLRVSGPKEDSQQPTLPRVLQGHNYSTHLVGACGLGAPYLDASPRAHGYEHTHVQHPAASIADIANAASSILRKGSDGRPLLLHVTLRVDQCISHPCRHAHCRVDPAACAQGGDPMQNQHCKAVAEVDRAVGQIIDALDNSTHPNKAIVGVLSSGGAEPWLGGSNGLLRGGGGGAWEGDVAGGLALVRAPLDLSRPPGHVHTGVFHACDWFPSLSAMVDTRIGATAKALAKNKREARGASKTVDSHVAAVRCGGREVCGIKIAKGKEIVLDGHNMLRSLADDEPSPRNMTLLALDPFTHLAAIRKGDLKLILGAAGDDTRSSNTEEHTQGLQLGTLYGKTGSAAWLPLQCRWRRLAARAVLVARGLWNGEGRAPPLNRGGWRHIDLIRANEVRQHPMWLFNVTHDPGEQENLLKGSPSAAQAWVQELQAELNHYIADFPVQYGGQECPYGLCLEAVYWDLSVVVLAALLLLCILLTGLAHMLRAIFFRHRGPTADAAAPSKRGPRSVAWHEELCADHLEAAEAKLLDADMEVRHARLSESELIALLYCHTGQCVLPLTSRATLAHQVTGLVEKWNSTG